MTPSTRLEQWNSAEQCSGVFLHIAPRVETFLPNVPDCSTVPKLDSPSSLVEFCRSRGIEIWTKNGSIQYRAPRGSMTKEIRSALTQHKQAVVSFLATTQESLTNATSHLRGPRRTPWGTWVWSDPDEPSSIEWFGPPRDGGPA